MAKSLRLFSFSFFIMATLFFSSSCGQSGRNPRIEGVRGPFFDLSSDYVLMSMQFEKINLNGGARVPFMKKSFVDVVPAQDGEGTMMQIALHIEDIESEDFRFAPPQTLPGGRPIPGIIGGQLPAVAVNVPSFADTTFYIGPKVLGAFVPVKLETNLSGSFRLWQGNKSIGLLHLIGQDENQENAGMAIMINWSKEEAKILKRMMRKRSPLLY